MSISPLALAAKKTIEAAWLHGTSYDLASQAAFALESTQQLQSPETAAEHERVANLLVARTEELLAAEARIAELEALTPAAVQTCRKCGAGYSYGNPCSNCLFQARMAAESRAQPAAPVVDDGCTCPPTSRPHQVGCPLVEFPVDGLTATFMPVASLRELDGLRERLPLDDPDRHALDFDADVRFARMACEHPDECACEATGGDL